MILLGKRVIKFSKFIGLVIIGRKSLLLGSIGNNFLILCRVLFDKVGDIIATEIILKNRILINEM